MKETYKGFEIRSKCRLEMNGKYSVGFCIQYIDFSGKRISSSYEDRKTFFILEVEAEKESIRYGKYLINNGHIK